MLPHIVVCVARWACLLVRPGLVPMGYVHESTKVPKWRTPSYGSPQAAALQSSIYSRCSAYVRQAVATNAMRTTDASSLVLNCAFSGSSRNRFLITRLSVCSALLHAGQSSLYEVGNQLIPKPSHGGPRLG